MHNISVLWSPQGNQIVHRRNVDTDLIWYIWSVTKPFLLCWMLRSIKAGMTQLLTAKLAGEEADIFLGIFSPRCSFHRWDSAASPSVMCAIQLLSSRSLLKPALTVPAQGLQLDGVGGEPAVGNHLLAKGTDGTDTSKMFVQQQSKKSSWQADRQKHRNLRSPQRAEGLPRADLGCRNPGNPGGERESYPKCKELKHRSLVFTGKVLVSLNDWWKWKSGQAVMI